MKVKDYLAIAHKTDRLPTGGHHADINPRLGLAGEIGYLLTALKKEVRDSAPTAAATKARVKDELGDITWYAVTIARRAELDFERDVLFGNLEKVHDTYTDVNAAPAPLLADVLKDGGDVSAAVSKGPKVVDTFGRYQELASKTSKYKNRDGLVPYLVQAWNNAGELLAPFGPGRDAKLRKSNEKKIIAGALGDIMWYIVGIAKIYHLSMDEIMSSNAEKIVSAFPAEEQKDHTPLYDEGFSPLEQFPRRFDVDFVLRDKETAVMLINGVRVGDPLTDNSYEIDGYRFHDSIHLAFIAVLGWSPVMRGLLKRKRKSHKRIDGVEDGARAQIVEEMIVKIAHSYAVGFGKEKLLDGKKYINLNLLKDINQMAEGLEVAGGRDDAQACKYWEWQDAILSGFKIYNQLRRNRGGRIVVDLNKRTVAFKKLRAGQATPPVLSKQ